MRELERSADVSRAGRDDAALARRLELLARAEKLARLLGVAVAVGGGDSSSTLTCEGASNFWKMHVRPRWDRFRAQARGILAAAAEEEEKGKGGKKK